MRDILRDYSDYPNFDIHESWTGSIAQSGTDNPAITTTLNELEVTLTATRISEGIFRVEGDTNFMLNSNMTVSYTCSCFNDRDYLVLKYIDAKTFEIKSTLANDVLDDNFAFDIEIKVYPFRDITKDTTTEIKINN